MDKIFGVINDVIYHNEENSYSVCLLDTEEGCITIVGTIPFVSAGERLSASGEWTNHLEYGEQFKVESFEKSMPQGEFDILKYLESGVIKGIGIITAKRIVDTFGEDSLDVIANVPEKLSAVKGISPKKAAVIGQSYAQQVGMRDVVMFLQKYNVSPTYSAKVYKQYKNDAIAKIKENPYILAEEISGIGFTMADRIAISMGLSESSRERVEAGIRHCLFTYLTQNGHTFLPKNDLIPAVMQCLNVEATDIEAALSGMVMTSKVISSNDEIYFPAYYYAELGVARRLAELTSQQSKKNVVKTIKKLENEEGITLSKSQFSAVKSAINSGVIVITGGPGTGKTTIVNMIIKAMQEMDKSVGIAAPTGRAAKRMSEICGMEAKTIHRMLEMGMSSDGKQMFAIDEKNPLEFDVVIVDELSMVDVLLMHALLKAIKPGTHLVMVGDADQLPSVGAGNVLKDIISSEKIPVVQLTEIFRQAEESRIITNAHSINNGKYPDLDNKSTDFFYMPREGAADIVGTIVELCSTRLPKKYDIDPISQIQVLTPMRRSAVGVNTLNAELQRVLNRAGDHKNEIVHGTRTFREGDKVMQIKNNYNVEWTDQDGNEGSGVFNGDVGYIERIDDASMQILFDDSKTVECEFSRLEELELAYAMTIHKSQGSEFDIVIMPMFSAAPLLLNRNLLYTGVTRAKKMVILVGLEHIIHKMVDTINEQRRYSGLEQKLKEIK